jgi:diguanylate cyclase (GGDEF)-like protein
VTRLSRTQSSPELSRGRLRVVFFVFVFAVMAISGHGAAATVAGAGAALGIWSVSVAGARGGALAHTFATADWLFFGLCLALSGGADSWLMLLLPLLILAHLAPSERATWPYLLAPVLLSLIVMAIADPSLGGARALGLTKVGALVVMGLLATLRLRRPAPRRRAVTSVDATTGFYSRSRLATVLAGVVDDAARDHVPLGVVCLRLDHFADARDFYGLDGAEAIVRGVGKRLKLSMGSDDLAFRARDDTLVVALKGRGVRETRAWAEDFSRELSAHLVAHHRQTVTTGVAAYPPTRSPEDLLGEAFAGLRVSEAPELDIAIGQ